MDCKTARLLLEFAQPGDAELDEAEAQALRDHLHECPECAVVAAAERRADEHLGRAVRDVPVPEGLRERLLSRLGRERDAWWKRWALHKVAAAAALFLAGWLGYTWWVGRLPAINVADVLDDHSQPRMSPQAVEDWFGRRGLAMKTPPLRDDLLASYHVAVFRDKQVPLLLYVRPADGGGGGPPVVAQVYVLSANQFDLKRTLEHGAFFNGSGQVAEVIKHPEFPDQYLYLIISTGGTHADFRRRLREG